MIYERLIMLTLITGDRCDKKIVYGATINAIIVTGYINKRANVQRAFSIKPECIIWFHLICSKTNLLNKCDHFMAVKQCLKLLPLCGNAQIRFIKSF